MQTKRRRSLNKPFPSITEKEEIALASGAKIIPLTLGKWTIVDAEDFDRLNAYNWHAWKGRKTYYARRKLTKLEGGKIIGMHQMLVPNSVEVDHRNRDGLDNRRNNLRPAAQAQNAWNAVMRKDNTTGFKGVTVDKRDGRFSARVNVLGKRMFVGCFATAEEASAAQKTACEKLHGEFAC